MECPRCVISDWFHLDKGNRQTEHDGCSSYPKHQPGYRSLASYNDFEIESVEKQESQAQTRRKNELKSTHWRRNQTKIQRGARKDPSGYKRIDLDAQPMDETWSIFKASPIETLSKACGVKKAGKGPIKKTPRWNENVKEAIKDKKKLYKAWVISKLEEDYIKDRLTRRHCRRVVKEAKEKSWK